MSGLLRPGLVLGGGAVLIALLAPVLAGHDPAAIDLGRAWAGPSALHPLGCDGLGRDVLARLTAGAAASLAIAATALAAAAGFGVLVGGLAGWAGGGADRAVLRIADLIQAFPELPLAVAAASIAGPGAPATVGVLALAAWPAQLRWCRALVLSQRTGEHVRAAVGLGARPGHILRHHLLPAIAAPVTARAVTSLGPAILAEATISGLGLGIQEPAVSLGSLIRDGLADPRGGDPLIAAASAMVALIVFLAARLTERRLERLDPRSGP